MSNNKNNREQDKLINMHDNQMNPGLAKPEDFKIKTHAEAATIEVPLHGQCGNSRAEYERLEKEGSADGKSPDRKTPDRNDVNNRTPKARISAETAPRGEDE